MQKNSFKIIQLLVIALVSLGNQMQADEPQDLTKLKDSYKLAVERAIEPLEQKYLSELEKLKLRYTKDGKLQEALAVDAEIKALTVADDAEKKKEEVVWDAKHLMGTWYCNGNLSDLYHFLARDNNRTIHGIDNGKWEEDGKNLTVKWDNGYRLVIALDQTEETIEGKSYPPGSTTFEILKFTRLKESQMEGYKKPTIEEEGKRRKDPFAPN